MAGGDSRREPVKVVLPPEPPELTPGAARVLLRILVKAAEQQAEVAGALEAAVNAERQPRRRTPTRLIPLRPARPR